MFQTFFARKVNDKIEPFRESDLSIEGSNSRVQEFLKLVQISQKDIENLRKIDDLMEEHAANIAERHYEMIMRIPEIKNIFEKHTYYERYTQAIIKYYKQLTKPQLNDEYIEYRKKIGKIHSRIRLTDEWLTATICRYARYYDPDGSGSPICRTQ